MNAKNFLRLLVVIFLVLLIPLIAMQWSTEVNWNLADFVVAAVLLLLFGSAILLVSSKMKTKKSKTISILFLFLLLIATWAELAVGIFGSPWAGS